ncbi:protein kinase [Dissoconium aciculare CBS 342.82]|uniref:EKC/KEOPS complex subunit BUD32 n=1 Tax=Dissoconium aciculare CBS 342.82 TaxID=1314786 RepID=A0A6J3MB18_9PEZI|nr:protein kinase [Dissoconium aciculare CBS 342.82]KAF1825216.1 protein kinase [Dissoconium aciculare CBS 342.82]
MEIEEETLPRYDPDKFLPVRVGDILHETYRVTAKLGFGTSSTVWLCSNVKTAAYYTLKVCIVDEKNSKEILVSKHVQSIQAEHPGRERLRIVVDDFEIAGPTGQHQCLLFAPQGMAYTDFLRRFPDKSINKILLQQTLLLTLLGLDFLHQAGIVHTDLSPNNLLLGANDHTVFRNMEKEHHENLKRRLKSGERIIYRSQAMPITSGAPVISDFGAAYIGLPDQKFEGDIMPNFYRAPEVILGMPWDSKVDIWSIGVMIWDLFEGGRNLSDVQHLAEMVSLMGPPPAAFLKRSEKCSQFWDSEGNWICDTEIPQQSFETREKRLAGEDKVLLLALVRKILRWMPEERPSAEDLFEDPFLTQYQHENTAGV